MTISSVGFGNPPSSDPPPPPPSGNNTRNSEVREGNSRFWVLVGTIQFVMGCCFAVLLWIAGIGCLTHPSMETCNLSGGVGIEFGLLSTLIALNILLRQIIRSIAGCNDRLQGSSCLSGRRNRNVLRNLGLRINNFFLEHPIIERVISITAAIFLLVCGITSIVTGSICVSSESPSSSSVFTSEDKKIIRVEFVHQYQ